MILENVKIEKLIHGGLGLAFTDGGTVFVENCAPGDIMSVEVYSKKGGVPLGRPLTVTEPSSMRVDPQCQYYGICGGCTLQHINYSDQVNIKTDIYYDCLTRIGKLKDIPQCEKYSHQPWKYRIRAQIKREKGSLGFFKKQSNDLIKIDQCPLLVDELNEIFLKKNSIMKSLSKDIKQIKAIVGDKSVTSNPVIPSLTVKNTTITVHNKKFSLSGNSFFQSNRYLLEEFVTWCIPYVKSSLFIDMFGGQGFFSITLSDYFTKGIIVESVKEQTIQAKKNCQNNNITNVDVIHSSAEKFFNDKKNVASGCDCLLVDPPRPGLTRDVRVGIKRIAPKTIVYVSCNPSTQARDIGYFVNDCGYSLEKIALFDLYPHTFHMETIAVLKKLS